jgi:hypothetical protein
MNKIQMLASQEAVVMAGVKRGPVWMFQRSVAERYMQARQNKQHKQQERG